MAEETRHIISVLVDNQPGVVTRVTGLFTRRGFNIESFTGAVTHDPTLSRITIVVKGDKAVIEQITKQLHKLIPIYKVTDLSQLDSVSRELALFKVAAPAEVRHEIVEIVNLFRASVVDVAKNTLIVAVTGESSKIAALEDLLRPYGIYETARTGSIALARGSKG